MRRRPPHIVVTTPESLYILLGSESGRAMLATTRTRDRRRDPRGGAATSAAATSRCRSSGSTALCGGRLLRIGLSATQKPIEEVARFLVGAGASAAAPTARSSTSATRATRDLALEVPAVAARGGDVERGRGSRSTTASPSWSAQHRTTLVFVNTRRMAERVDAPPRRAARRGARRRAPRQPRQGAAARRRAAPEARRAARRWWPPPRSSSASTSATSTWSASSARRARSRRFLQRVGRSGHAVGGMPKGRLFPLSRDELVECAALLDCVRRGELDRLHDPRAAARRAGAADRRRGRRRASGARTRCSRWCAAPGPIATLDARATSTPIVRMLAEGFTTRRGRRGALHPPRRGQRRAARPARRAADRAHLRRHDPRQRRLPGAARAARTTSSAR